MKETYSGGEEEASVCTSDEVEVAGLAGRESWEVDAVWPSGLASPPFALTYSCNNVKLCLSSPYLLFPSATASSRRDRVSHNLQTGLASKSVKYCAANLPEQSLQEFKAGILYY